MYPVLLLLWYFLKTKTMIESDIEIIAVDNDVNELDKIVKTFHKLRIGCYPVEYDIGTGVSEKFASIRIAFFDINLGALGNPSDSDLCNTISSALKEIIDINNGPYALIFWSKHTDKIDLIKEYIETREKENIPIPLIVDKIDKSLIVDDEGLIKEIKKILSNSTLEALLDYERKAKKAASKTINSIFSLIPKDDDKWGENNNFDKNFDLIFSKMAINALGEELGKRNPELAIQKALSPILIDNIQKKRLSSVWKKKMTTLSRATSNIKFPTNFNIESLNTIYHLDDDSSTMEKSDRGVVVEMKQTSAYFKQIFKKKKNDYIEDYFSYSKIKGKSDKEVAEIKKHFLDSCIPVFIEISASCDYAQQNPRSLKYLFGIKFPLEYQIAKPKSANYLYTTPGFSLDGVNFSIIFNLRYVFGFQIDSHIFGKILFKLSDNLINLIGNKYANHASRIGIISY